MAELAVAEHNELSAGEEQQLVTMMVDNQLFGIPILRVQDIVEPEQITPVPLAPSAIAGVLNLRGRIVTVIDLRECLGSPPPDETGRLMSVTVEHKGDLFTLLVDSIGDVRSLPRAQFDKPPVTLDQRMRRLCSGVFRLEGELLAVLDVEKVLDDEFIASMPQRTRPRLKLDKAKRKEQRSISERAKVSGPAKHEKAEEEAKKPASKKPANDGGTAKQPAKPAAEKSEDKGGDRTEDASGSLYDRLGGEAAIDAAVDLFAEKAAGDTRLATLVEGTDMPTRSATMKAVLAQVFGGPQAYDDRDIRDTRERLVQELELDDNHFIALAGHLADSLKQMEVPDDLVHEALGTVEQLRPEASNR